MEPEAEKWGDQGIKPRLYKLPEVNYFVWGLWFSTYKVGILFVFPTHKVYCDVKEMINGNSTSS